MKRLIYLLSFVFLFFVLFFCLSNCQKSKSTAPVLNPFTLIVYPEQIIDAIPGQRCVFLVTFEESGSDGGAVQITTSLADTNIEIIPQSITSGQVCEVSVISDQTDTLELVIQGKRNSLLQSDTVEILITEGKDESEPAAVEIRNRFIEWLAENRPELGITQETEWSGTILNPHITVNGYYLFFSSNWEFCVRWHVTIPPHDWARMYLRHRLIEFTPSYGFEISSMSSSDPITEITPPDSVYR
jgi:hypothetical protein